MPIKPNTMTSSGWHGHRPLSFRCCLDISNARKHPSDYGISVSSGMLSLARTLRLTMERQHVCELRWVYWERLRFLAHKCSLVLNKTCLWKQTITSHLHPFENHRAWVQKKIFKKNLYTCKHTRQLQCKLQLHLNIGRKCISPEQSLMKVHIFPSSLEKVFSIFQLSGGNPFSGPSHIRILEKRERVREREQHIWQSTGMKVSPSS